MIASKNIPLIAALIAASVLPLATTHASIIFTESFESPDITGSVDTNPDGWATTGHPSYLGLTDENSNQFTTPYGSQALGCYTPAGAANWAYAVTTSSILSDKLTPGTQYTLSFNVAAVAGRPRAAYRAELVAINDVGGATTVLASVVANSNNTTDMSSSNSIVFFPNSTHAALIGKRIAVRLGMDYDYASHGAGYQDNPRFDNVVLDAVSTISPAEGSSVLAGPVNLSWTNPAPSTGSDVWVDVWFGTDPGAMTKVASGGLNLTSFQVNVPGVDTYYWRIDSYLDGSYPGTPVTGLVYSFNVVDSDGDGLPDEFEQAHTSPPSTTALNPGDDLENGGAGDGLTNLQEYLAGTNPNDPDSDDDGLEDGPEIAGAGSRPPTSPIKPDSDLDGLNDLVESNTGVWSSPADRGTNPLVGDTDADALGDVVETHTGVYVSTSDTGSSPLASDSDSDNAGDWYEVTASLTDPNDGTKKPNVPYPLPDPDASTGVTNKPVKVYIMSGQSNMLGFGTVNGTDTKSLETMTRRQNKFPNLIDGNGSYLARQDVRYRGLISGIANGPLAPGCGTSSNFIGPELGFGHVMGWFHDEPVLLIKSSIGNRSLGWDILPPESVRYTYGTSTYPAYGESPYSWPTATGSEGPGGWYAGKQYDDYFLHEADMGMRPWVSGTAYPNSCQIMHNGVAYVSKSAHTAAATSEPGVGGTWSTFWNTYGVTNVVDVLDNFAAQYPQWAAQGFEIAGFVWWQGDKDRGDASHATRYEQNLVRLITSLRSYYGTRYPGKVVPNAPFVLATLGQTALNAAPSNDKTLLDAMLAVDGETGNYPQFEGNVKTVYAHPLSEGGASNSHYNERAGTYMLVGDALGRAMVSLESSVTPPASDYQNWAALYPGHNLSDSNADLDGDGQRNNEERAWGLDPTSGASSNPIPAPFNPTTGTLTYTRRNPALNTGITYRYEWSDTLAEGSWQAFTPANVATNGVSPVESVTITLPAGLLGNSKLFVRVVAASN